MNRAVLYVGVCPRKQHIVAAYDEPPEGRDRLMRVCPVCQAEAEASGKLLIDMLPYMTVLRRSAV